MKGPPQNELPIPSNVKIKHTWTTSYTISINTLHSSIFTITSGEKYVHFVWGYKHDVHFIWRLQKWYTLCGWLMTHMVNLGKMTRPQNKVKIKDFMCPYHCTSSWTSQKWKFCTHTLSCCSQTQTQKQHHRGQKHFLSEGSNAQGNPVRSCPHTHTHSHTTSNHQTNCNSWSTGISGKIYMIVKMDNFPSTLLWTVSHPKRVHKIL